MAKYSVEEKSKWKFTHALETVFKNIEKGNIIYIVFSKRSFQILVFTLAMGIISNLILVYTLLKSQLFGEISDIIYIVLLILSIAAIISGIWLVFKGIDIVTDKSDIK